MNKKFLFVGFAAMSAFAIFSAFGGQTLEQQKQEIASAITAQLDEFRMQKQQECTDRVTAEAQVRYDAYVASLPPEKPAAKPGAPKKSTAKKPTTSKDPMPETTPKQDPAMERSGSVQRGTEDVEKRSGAIQRNAEPAKKAEDVEKRSGSVKRGGGGN